MITLRVGRLVSSPETGSANPTGTAADELGSSPSGVTAVEIACPDTGLGSESCGEPLRVPLSLLEPTAGSLGLPLGAALEESAAAVGRAATGVLRRPLPAQVVERSPQHTMGSTIAIAVQERTDTTKAPCSLLVGK